MRLHTSHITLCFAALAFACCTVDTTCRQDMRVRLGVALSSDSLRLNADSTAYEHVSFSNVGPLTVVGENCDSLLADSATLSLLFLPLRKDCDTTSFIVNYAGADNKVTLFCTRQETYVSLACGCAVMATIDSLACSGATLDSAKILNTAVTTVQEKHISLYFHLPQTIQ